jgi:hypothetical protein
MHSEMYGNQNNFWERHGSKQQAGKQMKQKQFGA